MKQQHPFWFHLINAWLKKGHYGLTLPFLVGAHARIMGKISVDRNEAESLINDMILNPVEGYIIHIRWCNDIQSAVFALYEENSPYRMYDLGIEINSPASGKPSVILEKNLAAEWKVSKKPEDIFKALIDHSEEHILTGNFSKYWTEEGLTYGPLSENSLNFIEEALSH